jgi:hypothetical protein
LLGDADLRELDGEMDAEIDSEKELQNDGEIGTDLDESRDDEDEGTYRISPLWIAFVVDFLRYIAFVGFSTSEYWEKSQNFGVVLS